MAFVQLHSLAYPPIGRWLKAQRDVLGYTLAQASDKVQMSEKTLQLLESEHFLDLPEPVFVKGYLRRYAHQLKLNPHEVITLFDAWMQVHQAQQHGEHAAATPPSRPSAQPPRQSFLPFMGRIHAFAASAMNSQTGHAAAVIVCIGLFSFFLSNGSGKANSKIASGELAVMTPQKTVALNVTTPVARPAANLVTSKPVIMPVPASAARHNTWLIASETTHVHVIDKRGLIVFSGLVRAGSPVILKGSKPFNIQAAKAGTVSLINDENLHSKPNGIAVLW